MQNSTDCRNTFLSDLLRFDTAIATWVVVHSEIPGFAPRANHTAVRVGQQIWVVGGSNKDLVQGDVAVLDLTTMQWTMPQLK